MWLAEVMQERGVDFPEPPWDDVVASCGVVSVFVGEYAQHLRTVLPEDAVLAACRHLVLVKLMRGLMPDLSAEAEARAVAAELERRRQAVLEDPAYRGLSYDQVAVQRGTLPSALERDPELVATALGHVWIDRKHDEDSLRELYRNKRAYFDGHFGEALDCSVLFLHAAAHKNELVRRTFDEARKELGALAPQLVDREAFRSAVVRYSEDAKTKAEQGAWGWVTSNGDHDETIRRAVFARHAGGIDRSQRLVGPLNLPSGVALIWVDAWRPAPDWTGMRSIVRRELRRIFVRELLPEGRLVTYLDPPE